MRSAKPPALAAWLLEHVRFCSTDVALAGDLQEEFQRRQSSAWYWRQALIAILSGFASDLCHAKALAVRAIALSWAVSFGVLVLGRWALAELARPRVFAAGTASLALTFLAGAAGGWLVALTHRGIRNAVRVACGIALSGWAATMIALLKPHASQAPLGRIAAAILLVYVLVLAGFVAGGLFVAPKSETNIPRPTL